MTSGVAVFRLEKRPSVCLRRDEESRFSSQHGRRRSVSGVQPDVCVQVNTVCVSVWFWRKSDAAVSSVGTFGVAQTAHQSFGSFGSAG